ncbi:hypothetical protein CVV67_13060 [Arthrobacter stackebrandtii]|nr:hypothetical protein CVV67_13060 [Arthrobacter stackebrandtii]
MPTREQEEPANPAAVPTRARAVPANPAAEQLREAVVPATLQADPAAEPARSVQFRAAARRLFPVVIPVVTMSLEFPISCAVMTARIKGPLGA